MSSSFDTFLDLSPVSIWRDSVTDNVPRRLLSTILQIAIICLPLLSLIMARVFWKDVTSDRENCNFYGQFLGIVCSILTGIGLGIVLLICALIIEFFHHEEIFEIPKKTMFGLELAVLQNIKETQCLDGRKEV